MKRFTSFCRLSTFLPILFVTCGCQVLTYTSPSGEKLSRTSLGTATSIAALEIETGTNGVRRIQIQGYRSDPSQALELVTEAAVRAALQSAK
jgi:hypothetical protein